MAVANAMCALCTHEIDANSVQEGLASVLTAAAMEALLPIDGGAGCFVPPAKQAIQAKFVFLCVSATTCSRHAQDCGANPPPTLDHLARVCKKRDGRLNALEQVLMPEQYDASEWFANVHVLSTPPAPATPDGEGGGEQAGAALTSIEGTGTGADAHGQVVGTGTGADSLADGLIGGAAAIAADGPAAATTLGTADGAAGGAADGASAGPSDGIRLEAANCATEGAPGGASDGAIDGANKGEGGGEAEVWGWRRKKSPVEKEAAAKAAAATAALGAAEKKSVETYNAAAQATNERQVATREGNPNSEATMLLAIANEKKAKQAAADASAAKLAAEKAAEAAHNAAVQATYDIEDAAEKVASEKAAAEKAAAEKAAAEKAAAEKAAAEEAAAAKAAAEKAAAEKAAAEKAAAEEAAAEKAAAEKAASEKAAAEPAAEPAAAPEAEPEAEPDAEKAATDQAGGSAQAPSPAEREQPACARAQSPAGSFDNMGDDDMQLGEEEEEEEEGVSPDHATGGARLGAGVLEAAADGTAANQAKKISLSEELTAAQVLTAPEPSASPLFADRIKPRIFRSQRCSPPRRCSPSRSHSRPLSLPTSNP